MRIDIAMTAAIRPDILERTLSSLKRYLIWGGEFRLFADIAPVGDLKYTVGEVMEVIASHFDSYKVRTLTDSPQADALKWSWQSTQTEYLLQWEDDWELKSPVNLETVIDFMDQDPKIGMVYFDRFGKSVLDYSGYKDKFTYLHSGFWERKMEKSLGGPPALLRASYAREVLPFIDGYTCLDILSREPRVQPILDKWRTFVYTATTGHLVEDIGKQWKEERGIVMVKRTERGVQWQKK